MSVVLVVDDAALVRNQLLTALTREGVEVVAAVDGLDAWGRLDAGLAPAIVLTDIHMPRMNGFELMEKLREDPRTQAIPVIVLTAEGQPDRIARARQLGARAWIVKPFRVELVVTAIRAVLAKAGG